MAKSILIVDDSETVRQVVDAEDDFGFREPFDIFFCRNVIIYFDRPTQERLLSKLVDNLESGGYIFLGHSETLLGLNLPLKQMAPSVYRKV